MSGLAKTYSRVRSKLSNWFHAYAQGSKLHYSQQTLRELQKANDYLMSIWLLGQPKHLNPLNACGRKYFSQSDEDGILLEILRRIGRTSGVCLEVGAGDGTENNTLILATQGWKTIWIDAVPCAFDPTCNPSVLSHHRVFVNVENVCEIVQRGMKNLGASSISVLSIDVDGNDGYLASALLDSGLSPDVLVIEINELLPPPIRFMQDYNPEYVWDNSKNSGSSLQSLSELLAPHNYFCVGCNSQTGVNAFFVKSDFAKQFTDIPSDLAELFIGRSIHPYKYRDHRTQISPKLIESILRSIKPESNQRPQQIS